MKQTVTPRLDTGSSWKTGLFMVQRLAPWPPLCPPWPGPLGGACRVVDRGQVLARWSGQIIPVRAFDCAVPASVLWRCCTSDCMAGRLFSPFTFWFMRWRSDGLTVLLLWVLLLLLLFDGCYCGFSCLPLSSWQTIEFFWGKLLCGQSWVYSWSSAHWISIGGRSLVPDDGLIYGVECTMDRGCWRCSVVDFRNTSESSVDTVHTEKGVGYVLKQCGCMTTSRCYVVAFGWDLAQVGFKESPPLAPARFHLSPSHRQNTCLL